MAKRRQRTQHAQQANVFAAPCRSRSVFPHDGRGMIIPARAGGRMALPTRLTSALRSHFRVTKGHTKIALSEKATAETRSFCSKAEHLYLRTAKRAPNGEHTARARQRPHGAGAAHHIAIDELQDGLISRAARSLKAFPVWVWSAPPKKKRRRHPWAKARDIPRQTIRMSDAAGHHECAVRGASGKHRALVGLLRQVGKGLAQFRDDHWAGQAKETC